MEGGDVLNTYSCLKQSPPTLPTSLPLHAQAAVGDGKQHATALTNAILTQLHLPAMPLTLLGEATELRAAATVKLLQQQAEAVAQLAGCLERLRCAVERLAEATAGLQQLLDSEASAPLLMEGAVFATLPLRVLGNMAAEVERMHRAELDVKAAVLHGFQQILGAVAAIRKGFSDDQLGLCSCTSCTGIAFFLLEPCMAPLSWPPSPCLQTHSERPKIENGKARVASTAAVSAHWRLHGKTSCGAPCRSTSLHGFCRRMLTSGGWRRTSRS